MLPKFGYWIISNYVFVVKELSIPCEGKLGKKLIFQKKKNGAYLTVIRRFGPCPRFTRPGLDHGDDRVDVEDTCVQRIDDSQIVRMIGSGMIVF